MNLLSGLEKFGLKAEDTTNLFAEEKKEVVGEDVQCVTRYLRQR